MLRDLDGSVVPFGKTKRTIEETFLLTTTLPSWMELSGNGTPTYSIVPPYVDYGYLQVNTSAALNDYGALALLPDGINMNTIKEISIEIDSLVLSSSDVYFYIGFMDDIHASTKGCVLQAMPSALMIKGRKSSVTTERPANFNIVDAGRGDWQRRKNLKFILRSDRTAILMEGDIVVYEHQFTDSEMDISGVLKPYINIQTKTAAAVNMRMSRIALNVVHN